MSADTITDTVDIRSGSPTGRLSLARSAKTKPEKPDKTGKPAKSEKQTGRQKSRSKAAPALILLAVIAAVAAVLAFNVFGFRSRYVIPLLERVPIVRNLLPPADAAGHGEAQTLSSAELYARINDLTGQLLQSQRSVQSLIDGNDALRAENARLKAFEEQQEQFKSDKAEFDRLIAMRDPQAYADFYAQVSPDNAETLYSEAVGLARQSVEARQYAKLIAGMDSSAAAAALEALIPTDIDLVVGVLRNMESASASAILDGMQTKNAAVVAKMMAPVYYTGLN